MTQKEVKSFLDKNIPLRDVIKYVGYAATVLWAAYGYYNKFAANLNSKFETMNSSMHASIDSVRAEIRAMPKCHCINTQCGSNTQQTVQETYYGTAGIVKND